MCSSDVVERVRETVSRRGFLGMMGAAAVVGAAGHPYRATASGRPAPDLSHGLHVQDLTYTMTPDFPVFPGNQQLEIRQLVSIAENGFYANELRYNEHTGTHMDAPAHFAEDGTTADMLPVSRLVAPLAVMDISGRAAADADAQLLVDDILHWEDEHGDLPHGAFVAMYSGWESRVSNPSSFINLDSSGTPHFPGFSPEVSEFLVTERGIVGIGVDTVSLDYGASTGFETHNTVLPAGKYGIECLANLAAIAPVGATIIVGGPKHAGASGDPSRVLALYGAAGEGIPHGMPNTGAGGSH